MTDQPKCNVQGRLWPENAPFVGTINDGEGKPLVRDGFEFLARPGDFQFKDVEGKPTRDPSKVHYFEFNCLRPRADGKANYCGMIRVAHGEKPPGDRTWAWDGNFEKPTLTPSINCHACWHGFMQAGLFSEC